MNKSLVIVPAYNEENSIREVIEKIKKVKESVDILIINDSSTDKTEKILQELKTNYVNTPFNLGIGGVIQTGLKYALDMGYDIVIRVDGDGQHNPEDIDRFSDLLLKGKADLVIGSRFMQKKGFKSTVMRRIGINFLSLVCRIIAGIWVRDITSGFHGYSKKAMLAVNELYPHDFPEPEVIVIMKKIGLIIKEIPVKMNPRLKGDSSIKGFNTIFYIFFLPTNN